MKYIDADLLRKEIEKERKSINGLFIEGDNSFYDGQDDAYNHTLALIDSLQQEHPQVADASRELVEAVEKYTAPPKGEFMRRTELLIIKDKLKKLL